MLGVINGIGPDVLGRTTVTTSWLDDDTELATTGIVEEFVMLPKVFSYERAS